MSACSAPSCHNTNERFRLFSFPIDKRRRKIWETNSNTYNTNYNSRLCEVHFDSSQWETNVKILRQTAIPTIFQTCEDYDLCKQEYPSLDGEKIGPADASLKVSSKNEDSITSDPIEDYDDYSELSSAEFVTCSKEKSDFNLQDLAHESKPNTEDLAHESKPNTVAFGFKSPSRKNRSSPEIPPSGKFSKLTSKALLIFVRGRCMPKKQIIACHVSDNGVPRELMKQFIAHIKKFRQRNGSKTHTSVYEINPSLEKPFTHSVPKEESSQENDLEKKKPTRESDDTLKTTHESDDTLKVTRESDDTLKATRESDDTLKATRESDDTLKKFFVCDVCRKVFPRKYQLRYHILNHHDPDPYSKKPFACDICRKGFFQMSLLQRHMLIHESNPSLFECQVCSREFKWKNNLKTHMLIHESEPSLKFMCDVCGKGFTQRSRLRTHTLTHDAKKTLYSCDICGKEFSRQYYLKTHCKLKHESDPDLQKPFSCNVCEKRFTRRSSLKSHVFVIHESVTEKLFECVVCNKGFHLKNQWKRHMLIHNLETSFNCGLCGKKFARKDYLRMHLLRHKLDPNWKKPFTCDLLQKENHTEELVEKLLTQCN